MEPRYTTPLATAGDDSIIAPTVWDVHSGAQVTAIHARVVTSAPCDECRLRDASLARAEARIEALVREVAILRDQLSEALKLVDLQGAELERWRELVERLQGNRPERIPHIELQIAFEQVLKELPSAAANVPATLEAPVVSIAGRRAARDAKDGREPRGRHEHGRRVLRKLPLLVQEIVIDPDEVVADGGKGWALIGAEPPERVAKQRGGYFRWRILRRTWARVGVCDPHARESQADAEQSAPRVVTAEQPESVWPNAMADASAIAHVIVSKYNDSLPLHRQGRRPRNAPRRTTAATARLERLRPLGVLVTPSRSHDVVADSTPLR